MNFDFIDLSFAKGSCIYVPAELHPCTAGDKVAAYVRLILDTGATSTHFSKKILVQMGYSDAMFVKDSTQSFSITGKYTAMLCKVRQLAFCGLNFRNHNVKVWETPAGHHVSGIIGMDILRYFNFSVNMDTQRISIERSQDTETFLRQSAKRRR